MKTKNITTQSIDDKIRKIKNIGNDNGYFVDKKIVGSEVSLIFSDLGKAQFEIPLAESDTIVGYICPYQGITAHAQSLLEDLIGLKL